MKKTLSFFLCVLCAACVIAGCTGAGTPAPTLNLSGTQAIDAGESISVTSNEDVTWSLNGMGSLTAQAARSVTYNAPAVGSFVIPRGKLGHTTASSADPSATLTATSKASSSKVTTITFNLAEPPAITTTSLPAGTEGTAYSQTITVTGGAGTLTYSVSTGSLPAGLSLSSSTGAITGTPTGPNTTSNFTVKVTDSSVGGALSATQALSITINLPAPPSITTASLPDATQGAAYNQTVAATSGLTPYTFTISTGSLPQGLSMDSSGHITGMPTGSLGTSSFTVKVTDSSNPTQSATKNLSIKVVPAPVVITTTSLPNGIVNTPGYSATLTSTGGAPPIVWSWAAQAGSTLPPGLVLAATGSISGTPTSAGTFNVTVTATDSSTPALTASKNLSVTIIPQLVITTSSPLPNGITNTAYTGVTLASTGGFGAVVWSLSGGTTLPPNLSLNATTGAVTGTPTTAGTFNFTVQAADSGTPQQKITKSFTVTIIQQLVITTAPALPTGSVSTPYGVQLTSSGGTGAVTWAVASGSTLPGGLMLNATGLLAGTPTTANTYHFSITATDTGTPPQTATVAFTLTITPKLAITTTSLPSGTVGTAYSQTLQTNGGGIAPISWSVTVGSLPPGLTLHAATGVIDGTPTTATGSPFNFTVQAADSGTPTQTASQALSISIATAPLSITTTSPLPNGFMGKAYSATLTTAGGNPPVTWSITAGALPPGLTLHAGTGVIDGTPTTSGPSTAFSFTLQATDSSTPPQTATKTVEITIVPVLSITTTSLPNGTVGSQYSTTVTATGGVTPYTWSWAAQTGSSLPPGLSIASATGVISGTPGGSGGTFNVTVTVADSATNPQQTASANFSITITVATLMVTTTSGQLPAGTVSSAYPNTTLSASGGIPPYTWLQTGGTLPPGLSLSASGVISGTPTTATGSPFSFTVTVTDSATPTAHTATATLSITVSAVGVACASGTESVLKGQYAFLFQGFDGSGPVAIAGLFSADGTGKVALLAGVLDINRTAGPQTNVPINSANSSYSVGLSNSGHRGCLTIATSSATYKFALSLGSLNASSIATKGRMIETDSTGILGSGELRLQDPTAFSTAAVNGNFAFGAGSPITLSTGGANRFVVIGTLNLSSPSSVTGEEDFNLNGQVDGGITTGAAVPITAGTLSISNNGRGTLTLTVAAAGAFPGGTFTESVYVVSATEILFVNIGAQSGTNPMFGGSAKKQSGGFSTSSLSGNLVLYAAGICSTCGPTGGVGPQLTVGVVNIPSTGSFSLAADQVSGAVAAPFTLVGTYTVDSAGRTLFTQTGHNKPGIAIYLVSTSTGYFASSGTDAVLGFAEPQTGGPNFTNASLSGAFSFGTTLQTTENVSDNSGIANFDGIGTVNGTSDQARLGSTPNTNTFSQPYSVTNGTGTPGRGTITNSGTTNLIFYIISSSKIILINVSNGGSANANPALLIGEK